MQDFNSKKIIKSVALFGAIFLAYFLFGKLGLSLATINSTSSPFWPASGIAIGSLLFFGLRVWPSIFFGALAINFYISGSLFTSLMIATGNLAEALLCILLFRGIKKFDKILGLQFESVVLFLASLFATAVGAAIGALCIYSSKELSAADLKEVWLTWWVGDLIGALVITPLLMNFDRRYLQFKNWNWSSISTTMAIAFIGVGSTMLIVSYYNSSSLMFFLFPIVLLALYFSSAFGTSALVLIITLVSVWCSLHGIGMFNLRSTNDNLIHLQMFLISLAVTSNVLPELKNNSHFLRPSVVLLLGWIVSGVAFFYYQKNEAQKDVRQFEDAIRSQVERIQVNFDHYVEALYAGASFYVATPNVRQENWSSFTSNLRIVEKRPGIHGIGIILPVKTENVNQLIEGIRLSEKVDFKIKSVPNVTPPIDSGYKYLIRYIEPLEKNQSAIGLDIASEQNRKSAAEESRDTGLPTITKHIFLVQDNVKRPGFLMFVPMYKSGLTPETVEARRSNFIGWTYAPFITSYFFNATFADSESEVSFKLYEADQVNDSKLIYDSTDVDTPLMAQSAHKTGKGTNDFQLKSAKVTSLILGNQTFSLKWSKTENFISAQDATSSWVAICGIFITLLLASLVSNMENVNVHAQDLAHEQTKKLRISEDYLKDAVEKAEKATKVKSEFLANMSHEIRTPMNAIVGMIDLVSETELNPEQKKYVTLIQKAGNSLLVVINDILDISKIESGHLKIEKENFSVRTAIDDVLSVVSVKAFEKGLDLQVLISPEIGDTYLGDLQRIKQVILNLLSNAIKFTDKGKVTIEVKPNSLLRSSNPDEPQIKTQRDDQFNQSGKDSLGTFGKIHPGNILFSVTDSGIGISEESITTLFSAFVQADSSVTKKFGGTGLGLALCKKLCQMMGGEIWVESELGHGATFFFTVDVPLVQSGIGDRRSSTSVDLKGVQVLIVDDQQENRIIISEALKNWGVMVFESPSAENALVILEQAKLQRKSFKFVITDHIMPGGMNGLDFTKKMKSIPEYKDIPIILLTSDNWQYDSSYTNQIGISHCITKPFSKSDLFDVIRKTMLATEVPIGDPSDPAAEVISTPAESALVSTITIPSKEPLTLDEKNKTESTEGLRILLVDDSDDNRTLIKAYLKNSTHSIVEADNGEVAYNLATSSAFDLILMDIQMPVLDGYSATKKIREWEKANLLPPHTIIAATAYALKEEQEKCLAAGCNSHLAKPIKKQILLNALKDVKRRNYEGTKAA